jgi:NAD(P)-dependent dehydrogenase (short-subunit alcohol dehydrogenase family)
MNVAVNAIGKVANPRGIADPDRLRDVVAGKTVLVTGASYGVGAATARKLAAAGATVLVVARSAVDEITNRHGRLDIVVSNAGKSLRRSLHEQYDRPHDFQRTIDVNYLGPIRLLLGVLPAMRAHGAGHIVNVSSVGVRVVPGPQWGAYQASKGAFDRWLRSVAPELHADGVDVTSIYFGLIRTRMIEPTPMLTRLPGLSADQAADVVARAIVQRPRTIAPPWTFGAEVVSVLLAGPADRAARLWHRRFIDSGAGRR